MEEQTIINRVSGSSLITFDLEDLYMSGERVFFDLAQVLFQGLILREKDLKNFISEHDWQRYEGKFVCVGCSADAIVPVWAFLQITAALNPFAAKVICGDLQDLEKFIYEDVFSSHDWAQYEGKKIVIKGCSKIEIPLYVYARAMAELQKRAKLISFGEACSNVPVWKKK